MAFTANKGLSVQSLASNVGTWGAGATDGLNSGVISPLDTMLGGITALSLASTTPELLSQSQAQNAMLRLTGNLLASIVISPDTGVLLIGFVYFENLTTNSAFSVTFTNSAGSVVLPQGRRGVMWVDTTNGPRIVSLVGSGTADPIPTGSQTIWYNASAPSGWTAVALNDYAIKIVSNGSGAVTSGSVLYSVLFNRTLVDDHTLTTNEIPAHSHTYSGITGPSGSQLGTSGGAAQGTYTSSLTGGGAAHNHGLDMRVQTAAFVLASRN